MLNMTGRAAEMQLSIDIGSEPISGSVSMGDGASREFSGWIELVATIESARGTDSESNKTLGSFPGANGGRV
jgi:hypothetical protein